MIKIKIWQKNNQVLAWRRNLFIYKRSRNYKTPEFKKHSLEMNYSEDLVKVLESELDTLIEMVKEEKDPFNDECVMKYYNLYRNYQAEQELESK